MSAHTPGPWRVEERDSGDHLTRPVRRIYRDVEYVPGVKPTTYVIGEVSYPTTYGNTVGAEERLANANLIAAAPELLAALKAIFNLAATEGGDVDGETDWEAVRAAIAKAEGRES